MRKLFNMNHACWPAIVVFQLISSGVALAEASARSADDREVSMVSAEAAARRALCLSALGRRADMEVTMTATGRAGRRDLEAVILPDAKALNQWLRDEGLWDSLSSQERRLLKKRPGSWAERDRIDASWRNEAAAMIYWALRLVPEILPYDRQSPHAVPKRLPLLKPTAEFLKAARLEPERTIAGARQIAELWLWRARTTQLQRQGRGDLLPEGWSYEKIIKETAAMAAKDGFFKPINDDFPAFRKPYRDLSDEQHSECQSIASERLHGLNWLCGFADDWDEVPTDT